MKIAREKYIEQLDKWWNSNNNEALIVLGIKNVGKTTLILDWLKERRIKHSYFEEYQYNSIKDVFNNSKEKSFDTSLAIINKMMFDSLEKLLIFDGVKPNDEIIVQLKKLCSSSKHRYILISDYGDYVFDNIRFLPVGSIRTLKVQPLDFKEYCHLKLNKYIMDSFLIAASNRYNGKLPFSDAFEECWEEYSNFGGFPSVISKLLEEGKPSAKRELINIKYDLNCFIKANIRYSSYLESILNNFSNERSKTYKRFVFSLLSQGGTYQRYKRALGILNTLGIINLISIEGELINSDYYDIFLCDPGLEMAYDDNNSIGRNHIIESVICSFGISKKFKVHRQVLQDGKVIDLVFDDLIPYLLDIKLRNTNSKISSANIFKDYVSSSTKKTYKPFILVDKGINYIEKVEKATIMPIWCFLLTR